MNTIYITRQEQLIECIVELEQAEVLGIDLEFDSHSNAYGVNLALIQVATKKTIFLIDPILIEDLQHLFLVFENPKILKIAHSPGEDLRLLQSLGCMPKNICDTEVVAKLLNYEKFSLSALLSQKLGIELNKKQQRSNWLKRPLTDEQLVYAALDVEHLFELRERLYQEAAEQHILGFVKEEQAAWDDEIEIAQSEHGFLKKGDLHASPYHQFVLNEVFKIRDNLARDKNKPAYQIMGEDIVRGLADGSIEPLAIQHTRGVYGPFRNREFAEQLAEEVETILNKAEDAKLSTEKVKRERTGGYDAKKLQEQEKLEVFQPIQDWITKKFGEFASRFILSNKQVNEIVAGRLKIEDMSLAYRRKLIEEAAAELELEVGKY